MCTRLSRRLRQLVLKSENACRTVAADKRQEGEAFASALWTKKTCDGVLATAIEVPAGGATPVCSGSRQPRR